MYVCEHTWNHNRYPKNNYIKNRCCCFFFVVSPVQTGKEARGQVSEKKIWVALAVASLAMLAAARWTTELAVLKSFQCFTPTAKGIFCKSLVRIHVKPMGRAFSQQQIIFHRELCCLMSNIIHGSVAFLLAWYFSFCWPLRCPCYWCCYHHCCYCWEHWQWCLVCFLFNSKLVHF